MLLARLLTRLVAAALYGVAACAACAEDVGVAELESGVSAYEAGDYATALARFLAARDAGLDSANLHFDLGLAYYKLGRHTEARAAFERLRQFPDYAAIADFHLGLVAARLGENAEAEELLRKVERTAPQAALQDRAGVALGRLETGAATLTPGAYLLALVGRDTNPALQDESVQASGSSESSTVELFGAFDYPLAGGAERATVLRGGGYLREYLTDNGLDQGGAFLGVSRERTTGSRSRSLSLDASASELDGDPFVDTFSAGAEARPAQGAPGLALRGQLGRIAAAAPYGYLEGWRLRGEAERMGKTESARWRVGYQLEFNDRADLAAGNEFFSHSPLRQRLGLSLDHAAGDRWVLQWHMRYRYSRYPEANRFMEGGTLREQRRVERLAQAGVQARRRLGLNVNWLLEYQYSDNASTIAAFDYDRHVVSTGFEWLARGQ